MTERRGVFDPTDPVQTSSEQRRSEMAAILAVGGDRLSIPSDRKPAPFDDRESVLLEHRCSHDAEDDVVRDGLHLDRIEPRPGLQRKGDEVGYGIHGDGFGPVRDL